MQSINKYRMSFRPPRAGIHFPTTPLDSRLRGNDMKGFMSLYNCPHY